MEGKKEFYKKVEEALKSKGYEYYDGDRDIPGKGRQHANKPDYIAVKGNNVYIGEIKSPAEGPKSSSWRQIQNSDTEQFAAVRMDVVKREKAGLLSPEIGGHEIIINGQIADYVRKIGINFDLPASVFQNVKIRMAYSMPESEERNVEEALSNCRKKMHDKITIGNGSITYLFS
ncbi:MAG: hypothetical protein KA807_16770 [Prolixibacteraceae bacterium]|nr:hypothetical protein [Prolixibacteraceae bacterium]